MLAVVVLVVPWGLVQAHCLYFLFPSHARALVALPPSPLLLVGLSRGVGHPFSKDPP